LRDEFGLALMFGGSVQGLIVNAWRGIGITSQKQICCTPIVCCSDSCFAEVKLDAGVCLISFAVTNEGVS
jgi:hypothetical protein